MKAFKMDLSSKDRTGTKHITGDEVESTIYAEIGGYSVPVATIVCRIRNGQREVITTNLTTGVTTKLV